MRASFRNAAEQQLSISFKAEVVSDSILPFKSILPVIQHHRCIDGDPIVSEFFVKCVLFRPQLLPEVFFMNSFKRFSEQAASLNVSADALYAALIADAEDQPPNWDLQGRQANIWKLISENT